MCTRATDAARAARACVTRSRCGAAYAARAAIAATFARIEGVGACATIAAGTAITFKTGGTNTASNTVDTNFALHTGRS
jgi:hypothetical protein